MTEVARQRRIEADAAQVWAVLADFAAIARWAPNVDHSCLTTEQTEGVGTSRRVQVGRTVLVEEVVDWSPPETLAYRLAGLPAVVRAVTNRWTIEPVIGGPAADGSGPAVNVTLSSTIDTGPRPPQRLAAKAIGRRLASANEELLAGLAQAATTGSGAQR